MHNFLPYAWFRGDCVPFEKAKLSIATHALHYGTAAFGGMRAIPDPNNPSSFLLCLTGSPTKVPEKILKCDTENFEKLS